MSRLGEFREVKFLLPDPRERGIAEAFGPISRPDHHGDGGCYEVFSLYFDSPRLDCLQDKIEGEEYKVKVRWRCYRAAGDGPDGGWDNHHLEIKLRRRSMVSKRRVALSRDQARRLLDSGIDGGTLERLGLPAAVFGREAPWWGTPLHAVVALRYRRTARLVGCLPGCRITFDRHILATRPDLPWNLDGEHHQTFRHLPIPTVFEIKTDGVVPQTFLEVLRRHDATPVSISKYGLGMGAIDPAFRKGGRRGTLSEEESRLLDWLEKDAR